MIRRLPTIVLTAVAQASNLHRKEQGQAMTEYVVVFILAVIMLASLNLPLQAAMRRYLGGIYFFMSLPLP